MEGNQEDRREEESRQGMLEGVRWRVPEGRHGREKTHETPACVWAPALWLVVAGGVTLSLIIITVIKIIGCSCTYSGFWGCDLQVLFSSQSFGLRGDWRGDNWHTEDTLGSFDGSPAPSWPGHLLLTIQNCFLSDDVPAKLDIGKLMKMIFTYHNINKVGRWDLDICVDLDLDDIYGKEFIFLFYLNLDLKFFFFNKFILFIYFWLHWVFIASHRLSLVAASGGFSSLWCEGFSLRWLLLLRSMGSRHTGFSSCGSQAQ